MSYLDSKGVGGGKLQIQADSFEARRELI